MKAFKLILPSEEAAPSELRNPLAAWLACCLLVVSVAVHFYALGTQEDPALLAYDESSTWRWAETPGQTASAASVLFAARQDFSALEKTSDTGTINRLENPFHSGFGFGRCSQLNAPDSAGMEAALLVLNFGPLR
jgi:hypothetical protein